MLIFLNKKKIGEVLKKIAFEINLQKYIINFKNLFFEVIKNSGNIVINKIIFLLFVN